MDQEEFDAFERVLDDPYADPIQLSHNFFKHITRGFDVMIGSGGFGEVYMGFVKHVKVAVKKLSQTNDFSDVQFGDELQCLTRAKHKNIVRCLGYCLETQKVAKEYKGRFVMAEDRRKYICFEYAPNKSLLDFLKDHKSCEWETSYQLIAGICLGLQHLHNKERITHLDLKPANILLDADMVPKITDFGLSKRFSGPQSRRITNNICSTPGYVAPEYWNKGEISFKADIYSVGVIMKNILKGSTDLSDFEKWYKSVDLHPQLKRCIEIAQLCVDDDQHKRPTIDEVLIMLNVEENKVQIVSLVSGQSKESSIQQATSSISKSADGVQSLPVSAGGPSSNQQHQQINSVLRGLGEQSTEGNNFVRNLLDEVQSMSGLGLPSLVQQNEQITPIPQGSIETSSTEASRSSVSKSTDNYMQSKVVSAEPSLSHHQLQQQQRIISGQAEEITEGNNFVPNLLDDAQSISAFEQPSLVQQITTNIPKETGERNSTEATTSVSKLTEKMQSIVYTESSSFQQQQQQQVISVLEAPTKGITETSKLLDVYPKELCFPFKRNKLIRCPLTLTNWTEHYVGVRITLTYPDKMSGHRFPVLCGKESLEDTACFETLGPHSTLAVPMTMKELQKELQLLPPCRTGKIEVLMILVSQKKDLEKLLKASNIDDDFLKRAQELEGTVHQVIVEAHIQDQTSCQAVIAKFMPTRTSSFCAIEVITDVHPTKTWLLAFQEGGCVSIWDYQTQEMLMFVQVTKVSTRERHRSRESRQFPPNLAPKKEDHHWVRSERSRAPLPPSPPPPPPPPRLRLPEDLYPQQEVDLAVGGSERWVDRGGVPSKLDRGFDGAQLWSAAREEGRLFEQGVLPTMPMWNAEQPAGYGQGVLGNHGSWSQQPPPARRVAETMAGAVSHRPGWGSGGVIEMAQPPTGGGGYTNAYCHGISQPVPTAMVEAGTGYWRRGEGRTMRQGHGRWYDHDKAAARTTQFNGPAATTRGSSWGGGTRKWAPTTTTSKPRYASSSRPLTSVATNDTCSVGVRSARFIAREQWLAVGDDDGCVHVYNYSTAAMAKVTGFTAHYRGIVDMLSVHPTRQLLLTAHSFVGTVKLWDWDQEWKCTKTFDVLDTRLLRLSWNPSETNVFATLSYHNILKLWKTDSSDPSTTMEGINKVDYLCSGSQSHLLVTTSHLDTNDKKSAMIWDSQTKKHVHRLGLSGCDIYDIACHPTLPILATSHSDGSIVCLWNTMSYRLETILQLPESHSPGSIFITSTEDVTRLVTQCRGGISTVEIKMPTTTWIGIHNGGEN